MWDYIRTLMVVIGIAQVDGHTILTHNFFNNNELTCLVKGSGQPDLEPRRKRQRRSTVASR